MTITLEASASLDDGLGPIGMPMPEGKPDISHLTLQPTPYHWRNPDGKEYRYHVRHWLPDDVKALKGILFFVHGYGGHLDRTALVPFATGLAKAGYAFLGFDMLGHGFSPGERALVHSLEELADDWVEFIRFVRFAPSPQHDGNNLGISQAALVALQKLKYAVMGESMGGLLALMVSSNIRHNEEDLQKGWGGCIAIAPALAADVPPAPVVWFLRNLVAPLVPSRIMPSFLSKSAQIEVSALLKDEELRKANEIDDFGEAKGALGWRKGMKWGTAGAFTYVFSDLDRRLEEMDFPYLVIADPKDEICLFEGSQKLLEKSPSTDGSIIEMHGSLHDIVANDPQLALSHILKWVSTRL